MSNDREVVYTQNQVDFIKKLHNEIRRNKELWKMHVEIWGDQMNTSFNVDLNYFVHLVEDSLVRGEEKLAIRVLDRIEKFLEISDEETRGAVTYFFFETLTNCLGHEEEKYMGIFVSLLGPYSKECCRELDKFWKTKTPGI